MRYPLQLTSELKHQEEFLVSENGIIPSGKLMTLCQARFWVCARRCSILFTASWSHIFEYGSIFDILGPSKTDILGRLLQRPALMRTVRPSGSLSRLGLAARGWARQRAPKRWPEIGEAFHWKAGKIQNGQFEVEQKTGYQLSITVFISLLSNFVGWSVGSRVSIGLNQTAHQVGGWTTSQLSYCLRQSRPK